MEMIQYLSHEGTPVVDFNPCDHLLELPSSINRHVHTKPNQQTARAHTLDALQTAAAFQHVLKRTRPERDDQIGPTGQGGGDDTKQHELPKYVAVGVDKLWNESKKEEGGFGVENFGDDTLTKRAPTWDVRKVDVITKATFF